MPRKTRSNGREPDDKFKDMNRAALNAESLKRNLVCTGTNASRRQQLRAHDAAPHPAAATAARSAGVSRGRRGKKFARPPQQSLSPKRFDFDYMTMADLRVECAKRGLNATGVKFTTIMRLQAHDNPALSGPPRSLSPKRSNFDSMTMAELRVECAKRGLNDTRVKLTTIIRLQAHDNAARSGPPRLDPAVEANLDRVRALGNAMRAGQMLVPPPPPPRRAPTPTRVARQPIDANYPHGPPAPRGPWVPPTFEELLSVPLGSSSRTDPVPWLPRS